MFFWDSFSLEDNDRTCVQYRCETFEEKKGEKFTFLFYGPN